jgi:ankyrin repeat protein
LTGFFLILQSLYTLYGQEAVYYDLSALQESFLISADEGDTVMVSKLIDAGLDVNSATWDGVTALMYAVDDNNTGMAKLLISRGANINLRPRQGYPALITALQKGYLDLAEYLIQNGADVDFADARGIIPLQHAISADSFYTADMLLYYGADVNKKNKQGITALTTAAGKGRLAVAASLINAGADVNASDENGWTALHYATANNQRDIIELLIASGANVQLQSFNGFTPLSLAVSKNLYGAARVLISYGADVNLNVNKHCSPLSMAIENKNDSLVAMLRNHEAKENISLYAKWIVIGAGFRFNEDDKHLNVTFGLCENKYRITASLGYGLRTNAVQVIKKETPGVYYQFWENRHFVTLGVEKAFMLNSSGNMLHSGFYAGVSEMLTFGGYKGSEKGPGLRLLASPRVGGLVEYRGFRLKLGFEYLNLHLVSISKTWFGCSVEVLLNRGKKNAVPSAFWF